MSTVTERPRRRTGPSHTRLKDILRGCAFDPRNDGPTRVVVEIAQANPRYAEDKAIELIREGQLALGQCTAEGVAHHADNLKKAIGMLALALAVRA